MPGKHIYPYRKGVDITAWVLQILVCLIQVGVAAALLAVVDDYEGGFDGVRGAINTSAGVSIGISALTIVIDIVEIVLIARKNMPPALYLSFACIKTLIWLIIFVLDLITLAIVGIILSAIVVITSVVQLAFGARIVHKKRKGTLTGGKYVPTLNPAATGHVETGYGVPPQPQAYGVPQAYGAPQQPQAYNDPYTTSTTPVSSEYYSPTPTHHHQQQHQPPPPQQQGYANPGYAYPPNSYELSNRS
ncbi:hypothetical protein HD806DRAFT_54635 [Xylariaceae sp. AK1471]|nr:hypothetical protein HD806DRAFT_54635 [Xylariaceae sp. AK1471]